MSLILENYANIGSFEVLHSKNIKGQLNNSVVTSTTVTATNVTVSAAAPNANVCYPTLVGATSGSQALSVHGSLSYSPSTSTLSCANLNGTCARVSVSSAAPSSAAPSSAAPSETLYPTLSSATTGPVSLNVSPSSLQYTPSTSTLSCANFAGNASSATTAAKSDAVAVAGVDAAAPGSLYPVLAGSDSGFAALSVSSSDLSYSPSTQTLTCANLNGNASSASSVSVNDVASPVATDSTFHVPFLGGVSGNVALCVNSSSLSYVPNTDTLSCANLAGNAASASTLSNLSLATGSHLLHYNESTGAISYSTPLPSPSCKIIDLSETTSLVLDASSVSGMFILLSPNPTIISTLAISLSEGAAPFPGGAYCLLKNSSSQNVPLSGVLGNSIVYSSGGLLVIHNDTSKRSLIAY